jgi:hypothetical protein
MTVPKEPKRAWPIGEEVRVGRNRCYDRSSVRRFLSQLAGHGSLHHQERQNTKVSCGDCIQLSSKLVAGDEHATSDIDEHCLPEQYEEFLQLGTD